MKKFLALFLELILINSVCFAATYSYDQYIHKARLCFDKNEFSCAHANLKRAIDLAPSKYKSYALNGMVYMKEQKYYDAIWAFDKALELEPKDILSLTNRGTAKCYNEDYKEAIEDFEKALSVNPNMANIWALKSYANFSIKNKKEALSDAEKAIKLQPNNIATVPAYIVRGTLTKNKADLATAEKLRKGN